MKYKRSNKRAIFKNSNLLFIVSKHIVVFLHYVPKQALKSWKKHVELHGHREQTEKCALFLCTVKEQDCLKSINCELRI